MKKVGLIGWRGMVGSVLMSRMIEENDFSKIDPKELSRARDIERIVDTAHERQDVEHFARVVSRDEIRENDYNLNIPRYVDTFEEEDKIDLTAVSNQLQQLDVEMKNTDDLIAQFCKELNISTPF